MDYQAQIASITKQIADVQLAVNENLASAKDWQADANNDDCSFTLKSKREDCESKRAVKLVTAESRRASARAGQAQILGLQTQLKSILEAQANEEAVNLSLANKGISGVALQIVANGTAESAKIQAKEISAAQAKAIETTSTTQASATKMKNIAIFIAIIVLLAVAVIIIKNRQKSKK